MSVAVAHHESDEGRAALEVGVSEARLRRTTLHILHIAEGNDEDLDPVARDHLMDAITGSLNGLDATDLDWELHTAAEGWSTAGAIVDLVSETGAELLVMGSRRRTAVGKFLLGSTVQRVILDCPVPVFVVKSPDPDA